MLPQSLSSLHASNWLLHRACGVCDCDAAVQCPKCEHDRAFWHQFQTRSADEPSTNCTYPPRIVLEDPGIEAHLLTRMDPSDPSLIVYKCVCSALTTLLWKIGSVLTLTFPT